MKFAAGLAFLAASAALVSAHTSIQNPLPRGSPLNSNSPVQDFNCHTVPFNGGGGCAPKTFPCNYAPDKTFSTTLTAGQIFNVSFYNPNFPTHPNPSQGQNDQARHNGGQCEFSLSYDGGKTYTVIATYHRSCPDIFFEWPVKVPDNAPSCNKLGDCLFSWSWINAVGNREFYQNCADVKIVGTSTKPLKVIDITRANLASAGFNTILTPQGDPKNSGNTIGSGPFQSDVKANLALKIPSADGSLPSGGSSGNSTSGSGSSGKGGKGGKKGGKKGKKGHKKPKKAKASTTGDAPAPTSTGSSGSGGGSCSEGAMTCGQDKTTFDTCVNGQLVSRQCPSGTVCTTDGSSITCTYPKRSVNVRFNRFH